MKLGNTSLLITRVPAMMTPNISLASIPRNAVLTFNDQRMKEESLPFTVRVVSNAADLEKAVRIRHAAYMRHVPGFAQSLTMPEQTDSDQGTVVLLAESKFDASPIGTMRIQTNEAKPLSLEESLPLPPAMATQRLAEATRLGVTQERVGRMVTTALFKAYYQYCVRQRIDWMVITARSPVDRHYDRLLFKDVYPEIGYIPFKHVGNLPHRVMSLQVSAVHDLWENASHPLFNFFFGTFHEDIDVAGTTLYEKKQVRNFSPVAQPLAATA
jgi:hypothetical protein